MLRTSLLLVLLFAFPAFAAKWNVDPITSRLIFEGEQAGEKFSGSFGKFTSTIEFDEAALNKSSIKVIIDMASAQVEGKDRMDSLPTNDWFASKQFPTATFTSNNIIKTGDHKYTAVGNLTIRDITKEIELPFTLENIGTSTTARGEVTLNRGDFGVGQGRWASDEWIKLPVKVTFELHASK